MQITPSIRKKFCKDFNIPVALFDEPYFSERLKVADMVKPCISDWKIFQEEIQRFGSEQEYFEYYNQVKDKAIEHLKGNSAYQKFNQDTHPPLSVQFPKNNLYSPIHDGCEFISVDMRKANFSALKQYDSEIFDGCETWEEWISAFTDLKHIVKSKYIRQVILGACNPGRQTVYEKYLTAKLYETLKDVEGIELLCLSNDELVFRVKEDDSCGNRDKALAEIVKKISESGMPFFRAEAFRLEALPDGNGYVKHFSDGKKDEYKCVPSEDFHIIIKQKLGIPLTENDLVFRYNGRLAKYIN